MSAIVKKMGRPTSDEPKRATLKKFSFYADEETQAALKRLEATFSRFRVPKPRGAAIRKAIIETAARLPKEES